MTELKKKIIDGDQYEFTQFGAKKSLRILMKLSKIVGKPLAIAATMAKGPGSILDKEVNPDLIGEAVGALTEKLDEDEVLDLLEELSSRDTVLCNGKKIDFNSHYENRLDHLFKVVAAALEVQYGNFLGAFNVLRVQNKAPTSPAPTM